MKILLKYWYIILCALLLSVGAAVGFLYLRKDAWMPPEVDPLAEARKKSALAAMSDSYVAWNFEVAGIEDMRTELEAERALIEAERDELEALRLQVEQERAEMVSLREEIDAMREAVRKEFNKIESSEEENLKRLARIYTEMKPAPIVKVFQDMNQELVVKIMAVMPPESAAGILEEMTKNEEDRHSIERAAAITDELRRLQK